MIRRDGENSNVRDQAAATTEPLTDYEKGYLDGLLEGTKPHKDKRTWSARYREAAQAYLSQSAGRDGLFMSADRDQAAATTSLRPEYFDRESIALLLLGDCVERMREIPDASVASVVTDPPYGLGFMGKDWDSPGGLGDHPMRRSHGTNTVNTGATRQGGRQRTCDDFTKRQLRDARSYQEWCEEWAAECLRVLQPGGFILAFGGTRTYHRLTCAVEEVGFEVRDTIAWLYGQGFPKHHSLLKPAMEPLVVARKTGRGWLNTQACLLGFESDADRESAKPAGRVTSKDSGAIAATPDAGRDMERHEFAGRDNSSGRWPANVLLDEAAAAMLDEQSGVLTSGSGPLIRKSDKFRNVYSAFKGQEQEVLPPGDSGGASRFFYVSKATQAERNEGLTVPSLWTTDAPEKNDHPTVKPIALLRWLVRLATPAGGIVLDPFLGSGTTAIAAALEGFPWIGIERDPDYMRIAEARISYWSTQPVEAVA